jgi:uncharacterized membrane protein HdeD (DUF308 family)
VKDPRLALWIGDGLGLIGVIAFSVLAALEPDTSAYLVGQIVSAALVLGSVLLLRLTHHPAPPEAPERDRRHHE